MATECYDGSEPVNVGSGKEISIRDLATLMAKETGFKGNIIWDATQTRPTAPARARCFQGRAPFRIPRPDAVPRRVKTYH
jgi:GDP-L-fucose synthase